MKKNILLVALILTIIATGTCIFQLRQATSYYKSQIDSLTTNLTRASSTITTLQAEQEADNATIQNLQEQLSVKPTIEYVEVPVIQKEIVIREVTKEVPVPVSDFVSLDELTVFLANRDHNIPLHANAAGVTNLNGICCAVAEKLRNEALAQRKYLSYQILDYNKTVSHAICMAWVGGKDIYFIEPATDRLWLQGIRGDRR